MRLWISKNSEVPVRDQLAEQIMLGIVGAELKPGQKLPSIRELARRYRIHPNTVNAAYRVLAERNWVEFRRGSGVYVCRQIGNAEFEAGFELDRLIALFLKTTRERGFSLREIQARLNHRFAVHHPDHLVVLENDSVLRSILVAELEEAVGIPVSGAGFEEGEKAVTAAGAFPVALYSRSRAVADRFPRIECFFLKPKSLPEALRGETKPPPEALVSVVSGWSDFLRLAKTFLTAAGIDPVAVTLHDVTADGWRRGLRACSFAVADVVTARELPPGIKTRVFRIVSENSMDELRRLLNEEGLA